MHEAVVIIMGAAVSHDGIPSGAMRRRISAALDLRHDFENPIYVVTGGVGKNKSFSEAEIMRDLLVAAGISLDRIIVDKESRGTLDSIIHSAQIVKSLPEMAVVVCSDTYHLFRSRLLFFLLGITTVQKQMPSGREVNGLARWIYYYARETVAVPFDVALLTIRRLIPSIRMRNNRA